VPARIDDPLINPLAVVAARSQFFIVQGAEALDDSDFASAAASYRTALDRDPQSWLAHRGLAFALQKMGDVDGAVAALEETLAGAAAGDGEDSRAHRAETLALLGDLEAGRGNDGRAIDRFGQSLAAAPGQPGVALRLGNALARRGRFAEAVAAYDRALATVPEAAAPAVLEKRATALVNLGRGSEALADFRRAVAAAPDDPRLRLRYAEALEYLGDPAAAAAERATAERLAGEAGGRGRL
jgi:tetratricopeptide (TPR) repeat protein